MAKRPDYLRQQISFNCDTSDEAMGDRVLINVSGSKKSWMTEVDFFEKGHQPTPYGWMLITELAVRRGCKKPTAVTVYTDRTISMYRFNQQRLACQFAQQVAFLVDELYSNGVGLRHQGSGNLLLDCFQTAVTKAGESFGGACA